MTTSDPIDTLKRRALRHMFEDGSLDLVLGLFTLVVGAATQRRAVIVLSVMYLSVLTLAWKTLHAGITARRTGFAKPSATPPDALFGVTLMAALLPLAVVAVSTLSTGSLWNLEHWPVWAPLLSGLTLAAGFVYVYRACRLARYAALALLALAGSVFFWRFPFGPSINPSDRLTLFLFAFAAVQMITGAVAMAIFVRRYPLVAEETANGH